MLLRLRTDRTQSLRCQLVLARHCNMSAYLADLLVFGLFVEAEQLHVSACVQQAVGEHIVEVTLLIGQHFRLTSKHVEYLLVRGSHESGQFRNGVENESISLVRARVRSAHESNVLCTFQYRLFMFLGRATREKQTLRK